MIVDPVSHYMVVVVVVVIVYQHFHQHAATVLIYICTIVEKWHNSVKVQNWDSSTFSLSRFSVLAETPLRSGITKTSLPSVCQSVPKSILISI